MIIGIDIDDVLVDFGSTFLLFCNETLGKSLRIEDFTVPHFHEVWGVTREEMFSLVNQFNRAGFLENMPAMLHAPKMIAELSLRHELHAITYRSMRFAEPTHRLINKHFSRSFRLVHCCGSEDGLSSLRFKHDVCQEIGAELMIEATTRSLP